MLLDEGGQLPDQLRVQAETQLHVDAVLQGRVAAFLEGDRVGLRGGAVDAGERRAAPQVQGGAQLRGRRAGPLRRRRPGRR
ncbi:hypothetical protein GCM10027610_046430 [Dactylosporangium cerinum]